ncbi:MAG: bifunctional phosphopantothenoylcysteine decarboxylase/phosphopantothenate--cysteine ligase CoaBC [Calditrichia bacterium]
MKPTISSLEGKKILVGITGGIAAYKMPDYIRNFMKAGAEVRVILSESAEKFVTRLTMETITGTECLVEMFPENKYYATHHIDWADWADVVLIAPATANTIGKLASGIADNLLLTILLASTAPIILAPAMNVHMWENPIVQENIKKLQSLGYIICPPESGFLACGYTGSGRLAPYHHIYQYLLYGLRTNKHLKGKKVMISLGPTREFIDPVRYISNYSSGKMGLALALETFARGAEVTVVAGPVDLPLPEGIQWKSVTSAREMADTILNLYPETDIFISAAAVADYTPANASDAKIKKNSSDLSLKLSSTTDILAECGKIKKHQINIGFALESDDLEKNGKEKLVKKNLNGIVINSARQVHGGMGKDSNEVLLLTSDGNRRDLPLMSKEILAASIIDFFLK